MRHGLYLRRGGGTWYAVQPCCCITLTSASKLSYQYRWQMALRNSLRLYYTIFGSFFPLYHILGCESMPPCIAHTDCQPQISPPYAPPTKSIRPNLFESQNSFAIVCLARTV